MTQRLPPSQMRRAHRGATSADGRFDNMIAIVATPSTNPAYTPTTPTSAPSTNPACRNTIATTRTTVASDSASRNSSAYSTTRALDVGTPDSASTRNLAGSAPERASVVRSAVVNLIRMCAALALHVIFHVRVRISTTTAASAIAWARQGRPIVLPARSHPTMKYADTPNTAANETAV